MTKWADMSNREIDDYNDRLLGHKPPLAPDAGAMSTSDGLGGPECGPLGDDHEVRGEDPLTDDDAKRLLGIAGEYEHLPPEFRRRFDQDGRDARYLRKLAARITAALAVALLACVMVTSTASALTPGQVAAEVVQETPTFCAGLQKTINEKGIWRVEGSFLHAYKSITAGHPNAPVGWQVWNALLRRCEIR